MQYPKQPLIIAAILSMASHSLACVDFGFTISQFDYGVGDLSDNGVKICTFNGYGGNKGYNMKCNPGYSAYVPNGANTVEYKTPHGDYTFATQCHYSSAGGTTQGGDIKVCIATPFC
ncbi:uncharacterized protein MYCGRDRAFT_107286 [Zymoseptoria tritici IPO323]|uniref:Uncharacterized protein n=1 Tax=Zymoseptoria tritici (strain CBS 115943 / IPO323) TaxID=336722 RepID=F9WWK1_ZYMTI|nr:uncharacterized protein MYCGRDRAFT_107286 [Zymoseptoria tritici IPO323]EGP91334.1 hypothetical protein MYCGRDRAFT_107286 [Zymoseptoria tritici IPO323]